MSAPQLSSLFTGVAVKILSAVEAEQARSNQHEFNGIAALKPLLGDTRQERIPAKFLYLGDENEGISDEGFLTWYDARERNPARSEWRLYFRRTEVMNIAAAGDLLLLARRPDGTFVVIVTPPDSGFVPGLLRLFGVTDGLEEHFRFRNTANDERGLDFASRFILEELGIAGGEEEDAKIIELVGRMRGDGPFRFPSTRHISALAREHAEAPDPRDDPDAALLAWLDYEGKLFAHMERAALGERIAAGFMKDGEPDVDNFLETALSVLNRRKSRMGLSLENHTEQIFRLWNIAYTRGAVTEGRSRPDFLFPGEREYHDPAFDPERLNMLGVKSTLKDRWRQVLAEAARIAEKHLLTIQPGVSVNQMDEMRRNSLRLVVPAELHAAYGENAGRLLSMKDFLRMITIKQNR